MMVKSAQPSEGGGCTPSAVHSIYHHKQSTLQLMGHIQYTLPLFILDRSMYSVVTGALRKSHLKKYTKSLSVSPPRVEKYKYIIYGLYVKHYQITDV